MNIIRKWLEIKDPTPNGKKVTLFGTVHMGASLITGIILLYLYFMFMPLLLGMRVEFILFILINHIGALYLMYDRNQELLKQEMQFTFDVADLPTEQRNGINYLIVQTISSLAIYCIYLIIFVGLLGFLSNILIFIKIIFIIFSFSIIGVSKAIRQIQKTWGKSPQEEQQKSE